MRRITSIIVGLTFITLAVTGLQMGLFHGGEGHGGPPFMENADGGMNRPARGPQMGHRESIYPKAMHEWAGYLFVIGGAGHLILNSKTMLRYLGIKQS
jgi:hypothetical protein